jgi:predicted regulator of Ras-like GTPase activity (Roadblock/LC7/MglB family)
VNLDPVSPPAQLAQLITDFTKTVAEVVRALVVSADGVPVAVSDGMPPGDLDRLSAITSGMIGLASGAALAFDYGAITQALVTMEQGTLVVMALGSGANLAVLTTGAADLEEVAYEMNVLAERAGRVVTPAARVASGGMSSPLPPQPLARRVPGRSARNAARDRPALAGQQEGAAR